jgi:hypothetical protein
MSEISQKQLDAGRKNPKKKRGEAAGSRALVKEITPEELELVKNTLLIRDGSKTILQELGEALLPAIRLGKNPDREALDGTIPVLRKALAAYGLYTHVPLEESVAEEYRPLVAEFSHQLVQDYDCKTSGEKALAETVVSAYIRILTYSRRLGGAVTGKSTQIGKQHIEFYLMLGKELDRANRHFITALTTLKQLKAPSLEINVKTQTAFVAQNQQINATKNLHNKDEIIDPK